MMNLSVKNLEAFCALEECRQFTAAARRCHVTQSAFSQIIAKLEAQIGMQLFDRDTRSVRLTAEGELFATKARDILSHIDRSLAELRDYANKDFGRLSLAVVPSLAASWLPRLLQEFQADYPGIRLKLYDKYSERCLQLLRESKVDIAVTALPGNDGECLTETLAQELFYLVAPKRHAPKRKGQLVLSEMAGIPIIHLIHTESIRVISGGVPFQLRPLLREAGVQERGIEVEHAATLAGLVAQGLGASVVPQSMLYHFKRPTVVCLPIAPQAMHRPIFLVQRRASSLQPAAACIAEMMRQQPPHEPLIPAS